MGLKLKNKKQLQNYLKRFVVRVEKALVYNMEALVAQLQNHAKQSAGYQDQTSNLKGSIGGVVLKDGRPISYKGFDAGGEEGNTQGLEYINSLISNYGSGYTILIVAGMEYATYVENYHNLNVLAKTELKLQRDIPKMLERLKKVIDRAA